jgi:PBSX family phage terminase large subunit
MDIQQFGQKAYDFIVNPIELDARINILEGSVRSGKTVCMIPKTLMLVDSGPKGLGVFTGVSKDTVYDNVLRDLFDVIGRNNYNYNRSNGELNLFGDEWKVIGAKDEGSEKYIRGKTIAKANCDELSLMPERFFKQLLNRMSIAGARLYGTTNPDNPNHYLYREYITDLEKLNSGMVKVIHFELDDNPNLSEEYKMFIRAAYSGVFYQRFILGLWVIAEGAIYKDAYNAALLFDEYGSGGIAEAPQGLFGPGGHIERIIGIDYGTTNPCVFLDVYDDGETLWQRKEYYWDSKKEERQKTDEEYVDDLIEFIGEDTNVSVLVDPSAASFIAALRARGIVTWDVDTADNSVLDGIRMFGSMMKRGKYRIHRSCTNTIREVTSYCWNEKKSLLGVEEPVKQNDHTCDAGRYIVKTKISEWRLTT